MEPRSIAQAVPFQTSANQFRSDQKDGAGIAMVSFKAIFFDAKRAAQTYPTDVSFGGEKERQLHSEDRHCHKRDNPDHNREVGEHSICPADGESRPDGELEVALSYVPVTSTSKNLSDSKSS